MPIQPEHRSILVVDIEGFGRLERTDPVRLRLHHELHQLLTGALACAAAEPEQYDLNDTGDGFVVTISSTVAKSRLLDPLIPWLTARLSSHNATAAPPERLRLRVVVHAGEVLRDPRPDLGHTVIFACRLLDAQELRACLAATDAPLVLMVSDWIYREVVQHRYGTLDPERYRPVRVTAKGFATVAWVYVPGDPGAVERAGLVGIPIGRSPYPGLEAFTEEDAAVFFGREPEISKLLDRLHPTIPHEAHRFVTVVGPSGAGKSSLVQAGLLPRLSTRRRWVIVPPLVPENRPIRNLARSLAAILPGDQLNPLSERLSQGSAALVECIENLRLVHGGHPVSVLLVIDQVEELLTLADEQERAAMLGLLRDALRHDTRLWVVATLRSEFLTGFLSSGFAQLFQDPVVVGVLGRDSLFEVIEKPAAKAGMRFEPPSLVPMMVADTGTGDALPLLAYTLQALYLQVGPGRTVTAEDYRRLGGVVGALARQGDKVAGELRARDPETPVLQTLLKCVRLDETEPTRRRLRRSSLSSDERRVVDAFVAARLLTSDAAGGHAVIEVAHEALFRHWAPLRQAIVARADDLRRRGELERWAAEWLSSGRQDAYLLRDERLKAAQEWATKQGALLVELPLVREFLDRSVRVDRAALKRLSEAIARRALAGITDDPGYSLLLALAAVEECAPTPLARQALLAALVSSHVRGILRGHGDAVTSVTWSPDGQRLASASSDRTARIWAARHGSDVLVLRGHTAGVQGVAWSPNSDRLATISYDRTVRVWDARSGAELRVLHGHEDAVMGVAWSPDGQRLATTSVDRTARVWDAERGTQLLTLQGHTAHVRGVAWAPTGRHLATASRDRTVRIWDVQRGAELLALHGHDDAVMGVAWSPDGQRLASASEDRTVRVWDAEQGSELLVLHGHSSGVVGLAWAPDGQRLATASRDRTARVWETRHGGQLTILRGHTEATVHVAWSPDGQRLATASYDRTVRIWDGHHVTELLVLHGHTNDVVDVAWSPDGRRLATVSRDRTARVWDAQRGAELLLLHGHDDAVLGVAWGPDGLRLASASYDRTVRIWDSQRGTELQVLHGHKDAVMQVAWSPDGLRLASASYDRTVRIWDSQRGTELQVLRGHTDRLWGLAWAPDGRYVATASLDRTARVWDAQDGTEFVVLHGHEDAVLGVAWSPDGLRLASASYDRTVRIWDSQRGTELRVLRGHEAAVRRVAWSPDGRRLATASRDRTVRIWDAQRASGFTILAVHEDWTECVAWSPDGHRVASVSRDRTARVWDAQLTLSALIAIARQRVLRELTAEERRIVMLPVSPKPSNPQ